MKKFFIAAAALLISSQARAETLTLADCLAIAEVYHPSIAASRANVSGDVARVASAAVGKRLTISANASQSRSKSANATNGGESSSFSAGLSMSAKLYDANRTHYQIDAARSTLESTVESAEQTRRSVRSGVKNAYIAMLLSGEQLRAMETSVRAYEQHLEQARGYYEAGSRALYDVTKAELDLGNARIALVEAEAEKVIARAELLASMGVTVREEFDLAPIEWQLISEEMSGGVLAAYVPEAEAEVIETALANRADHRSAELKVASSIASLRATARQDSPTISLAGGYTSSGPDLANQKQGWNASISMSVPVVDGGSSAAEIASSRASLAAAEATLESSRQKIVLEVRRALNDLRTARERVALTELSVANANENYRLAAGRYETGVGGALEVTDALVSLTSALLSKSQAVGKFETAVVALEDAIGVELTKDAIEGEQ